MHRPQAFITSPHPEVSILFGLINGPSLTCGAVTPSPHLTMAKPLRRAIAASALLVCFLAASPVVIAGN